MNGNDSSPRPDDPKQADSAVGIILTVVGLLSGLYSCVQLAKYFPIWLAVLITLVVGLVVVGSMAASLGNELMDVAIGCVVIAIVIAVVLPVGAKAFRKHFPASSRVHVSVVALGHNQSPTPTAVGAVCSAVGSRRESAVARQFSLGLWIIVSYEQDMAAIRERVCRC